MGQVRRAVNVIKPNECTGFNVISCYQIVFAGNSGGSMNSVNGGAGKLLCVGVDFISKEVFVYKIHKIMIFLLWGRPTHPSKPVTGWHTNNALALLLSN